MIIFAFASAAIPHQRDIENADLIRKQRIDRLVWVAMCGVFMIGAGTVWRMVQRIKPSE
jgi:hypothetical protein